MRKPGIILFGLCLWLLGADLSAQSTDDYSSKIDDDKIRVLFGMDGRNSFISRKRARIFGLRFGLSQNRFRGGVGIYWLTSDLQKTLILPDDQGIDTPTRVRINFSYVGPFFEYIWLRNRRWELTTPFMLGFANTSLTDLDNGQGILPFSSRFFLLMEPGLTAHYRFFPWIGLGAGVGYRQLLTRQAVVNESFDSLIYVVKLKFFLQEGWNCIFKGKDCSF